MFKNVPDAILHVLSESGISLVAKKNAAKDAGEKVAEAPSTEQV